MAADVTAKGIDLGIVVRDGDASVRFYTEVLGLTLEGSNPVGNGTMHRVRCGSSMLKLIATDAPAAAQTEGELFEVLGYRYLTITVDDVDAMVERCAAAGHPAVIGPKDMGPARIAMVEDPDGNRVEFLHLPA